MKSGDEFTFSFSEEFEVFPSSAAFKSTFPNVMSHLTLFLCNPRSDDVGASLILTAPGFRVSSDSVTVPPGSVHSLIVTFESREVGDYEATLRVVTSENSIDVHLSAKCVESPLVIPVDEISGFTFSAERPKLKSTIVNKSLNTSLRIMFDVDTSLFKVSPPSVDLPPLSQCPIEIGYSEGEVDVEPHFLVQCEDTGDSVVIPLNVSALRASALVDFGVVPVGESVSKCVQLPGAEVVPVLEPPFSVEAADDQEFLFAFVSDEPGSFARCASFGSLSVKLVGEAVALPFAVEAGACDMEPMTVTNVSGVNQSYKVSFSENFDRHHATKVKLAAGESQRVDVSEVGEAVYFKWKVNGKDVVWKYVVPRKGILVRQREVDFGMEEEESEHVEILNTTNGPVTVSLATDAPEFGVEQSVTIDPNSSQAVRVSFTPNSVMGAAGNLHISSQNGSLGQVSLRGAFPLMPSMKLVPFFQQRDGQEQTVRFSVAGAPLIKIDFPEWITGPDEVENMRFVTASCLKLPSAVCAGKVHLSAENAKAIDVPVIGYRGASDVHWSVTNGNDVRVENKGIRTAFVVFSCNKDVQIKPRFGILPSRKSVLFQVKSSSDCCLTIHYGDEILRQIYSELFEDELYEELHEHILRDEIGPIRKVIDLLDADDFAQLFKESVVSEEIELGSDGSTNAVFELSTRKLELGKVDPCRTTKKDIWIENLLMTPLEVHLETDSEILYFPEKIKMKPEERVIVTIEIDGIGDEIEINETIHVRSGEYERQLVVHGIVCEENDDFEAEILNFGLCEIGRLNRGILKLTNKKSRGSGVKISVKPPFSTPNSSVYVDSKSFIYISIHFLPQTKGQFHEYIRFDPEISRAFSVPVMGSAGYN